MEKFKYYGILLHKSIYLCLFIFFTGQNKTKRRGIRNTFRFERKIKATINFLFVSLFD